MAQKVLQSPRVHALARQSVARRMPKHVRMDRERQLGSDTSSLDHTSNAHALEWLPSLIDEHIGGLGLLLALQSLKSHYLVAFQIVSAVIATLEAAHLNGALGEVDVVT